MDNEARSTSRSRAVCTLATPAILLVDYYLRYAIPGWQRNTFHHDRAMLTMRNWYRAVTGLPTPTDEPPEHREQCREVRL